MQTLLNSEMEILNILKLWEDVEGNGRFATDLQGRKQISGGDPRTGTFHYLWVTMGDTACSVNGVLLTHMSQHMEELYKMSINVYDK